MSANPYARIKRTYSSKLRRIHEFFEKDSFEEVSPDSVPQDYINDCALALGMEYVLMKRKLLDDIEHTFFVINAGAPHLPLIGCFLKSHGIEPYFYIKGSAPSCTTSFLYFASQYRNIKLPENPGVAQLFDAHAEFDKVSVMPAVTKLKKLGIKKAFILVEYNFQPLNHTYRKHPEFGKRVAKYRKKRIDTEIIEIDPRPREKDYERIIDLLKKEDAILEKLSKYLKTDKKNAIKVIKNGKKAFFD